MREIKFRGWFQCITGIEYWVYGYLQKQTNGNWEITDEKDFSYTVDNVGQFTGIYDKEEKEIFEGDLIKIPDDWDTYGMNSGEVYEIFFNAGGFRCKPKINPKARGIWLEDDKEFELIGNIYENKD